MNTSKFTIDDHGVSLEYVADCGDYEEVDLPRHPVRYLTYVQFVSGTKEQLVQLHF